MLIATNFELKKSQFSVFLLSFNLAFPLLFLCVLFNFELKSVLYYLKQSTQSTRLIPCWFIFVSKWKASLYTWWLSTSTFNLWGFIFQFHDLRTGFVFVFFLDVAFVFVFGVCLILIYSFGFIFVFGVFFDLRLIFGAIFVFGFIVVVVVFVTFKFLALTALSNGYRVCFNKKTVDNRLMN